ncbi:hypothetical protein N7508_002801 [Penicillium antarcticum]|uniref:uncharacterized protein n=1 Tax=Penicillium antarcticum TaxID=416450 RepID=UPI00239C9A8C|nr:uncharacterized protein N7508_002801 [Penicillium antarcticum]KAJ5311971.1 hypothetical protein N7508_002801 [Penicillium antarcticum]
MTKQTGDSTSIKPANKHHRQDCFFIQERWIFYCQKQSADVPGSPRQSEKSRKPDQMLRGNHSSEVGSGSKTDEPLPSQEIETMKQPPSIYTLSRTIYQSHNRSVLPLGLSIGT